MWERFMNWCEVVGRYRAANELARQGYHKEAKALMCESHNQEKAQFIHGLIVPLLVLILVANEDAGRGIIKDKRNRVTDITFTLNS